MKEKEEKMSRSINKVLLVGNLGQNPELHVTSDGTSVVNLLLATEYYNTKTKEKRVEWHKLVAWGKRAEYIKDKLSKGDQLCVEGRIQNESFDDKNGQKHFVTKIVCTNVTLLHKKVTQVQTELDDLPQQGMTL
jgi:single-strand DNA-binding protein